MSGESVEEANDRYKAAMQGVWSGLAFSEGPVDIRFGVSSAGVAVQALARMLIAKGVFTEAQYTSMLADCAEQERDGIAKTLPGWG